MMGFGLPVPDMQDWSVDRLKMHFSSFSDIDNQTAVWVEFKRQGYSFPEIQDVLYGAKP